MSLISLLAKDRRRHLKRYSRGNNETIKLTRITKISMGVPGRKRLVLRHASPDGDFSENTRGSQRVIGPIFNVPKRRNDEKCCA